MRRWASPVRLVIVLAIAVVASATHPAGSASLAGASATLLSDGRWLILGGDGPQGILARAEIAEADGTKSTQLPATMHRARAWHTATVLPDGTVLIVGGVGRGRQLVREAELFRPATQSFELITDSGIAARAFHTATLLTDGRVLIAGGVSDHGTVEASAEMWSPHTRAADPIGASLDVARRRHGATLLPDGRVWITGGEDGAGRTVASDEVFEPRRDRFASLRQAPSLPGALGIAGSIPAHKDDDVAPDVIVAIRFSRPVRPASVSTAKVRLVGPVGVEPAEVIVAEGGRLAFIHPTEDLLAGAEYTVTVAQVVDAQGVPIPEASFTFTTAVPETTAHPGHGSGPFGRHGGHHGHDQYDTTRPGQPAEVDGEWRGERRGGKPYSRWQSLPPLMAPPGVTALSGQVLRLNGQPLADVTLQIADRSTTTDRSGRFLLTEIPTGYQMLIMDGTTANRPRRTYGIFDYGVYPKAGQTKVLPFTIWMPLLDTEHATRIPVPTPHEVVVTTPRVPGLEVRIPEDVVLQTAAGPLPLDGAHADPGGSAAVSAAGGDDVLLHAAGARRGGATAGRQRRAPRACA